MCWLHRELCTVWSTIMAVSDHRHYMQPYRAFVGLFLILAKKSHLSICYSRLEEEMSDYTFCNLKLIPTQFFKNVYAKIKINILLNACKNQSMRGKFVLSEYTYILNFTRLPGKQTIPGKFCHKNEMVFIHIISYEWSLIFSRLCKWKFLNWLKTL